MAGGEGRSRQRGRGGNISGSHDGEVDVYKYGRRYERRLKLDVCWAERFGMTVWYDGRREIM